MTTELPPELIDAILDFLAGDYRSLKACFLLCRAWVLRCRPHFFKTCTLASKNVPDFCKILRSGQYTFCPAEVRKIRAPKHDWNDWNVPDAYLNESLAALRLLTGVQALELALGSAVIHSADVSFRTGFLAAFPHVTHLAISYSLHPSKQYPPIIENICLFPALQQLDIRWFNHAILPEPLATAVPPRGLHILVLGDNAPGPILAWLHAFNRLPNVDSLTLPEMGPDDPELVTLSTTLRNFGGALRHLDIQMGSDQSYGVFHALSVPLHALFTSLTTLTLRACFRNPLPVNSITKLAAPALQRLTLLDFCIFSRDIDWPALDEFMSSWRFPALRKVAFRCTDDDSKMRLLRWLPLLATSGLLELGGRTECDSL
ncbi:hypothetical protein K438DRAFT_1838497 [Mycena galopus ATCC 62051]|nr:hypothetical protein K438DRAFT_1838497 [Mycena galopus ATCC 62051]